MVRAAGVVYLKEGLSVQGVAGEHDGFLAASALSAAQHCLCAPSLPSFLSPFRFCSPAGATLLLLCLLGC
jgi:hypothetical protein